MMQFDEAIELDRRMRQWDEAVDEAVDEAD
jgi:hypothetical protein